MTVPVTPPEIRQARAFLRQRLKAGSMDIPPRQFAAAAKQSKLNFSDLAQVLAKIYSGGQNESFYREQALEAGVAHGK